MLGTGAFHYCKDVIEVIIPEGIQVIGYEALNLYNKNMIENIVLPSSLSAINRPGFEIYVKNFDASKPLSINQYHWGYFFQPVNHNGSTAEGDYSTLKLNINILSQKNRDTVIIHGYVKPVSFEGIRRSGKSVILETIIAEIKEKSDNIIYLNFEKVSDFNIASNYIELINYVNQNKKDGLCYCFFDEIQEIDNWQKAVKDLRLNNCSIFITGSNSKLLSSEFLTLLSGRFVSLKLDLLFIKKLKNMPNY